MTSSMNCSRNDVVLLPISFTDLTSRKVRPAIVIGRNGADLFLVPISSVLANKDFWLQKWQAAGLIPIRYNNRYKQLVKGFWRWCILGHGKKTNPTGDECDAGGATQRTNPRRHRSPRQRTDAGGAVGHQWPAYLGGTGRVGQSRPLHHPSMAGGLHGRRAGPI